MNLQDLQQRAELSSLHRSSLQRPSLQRTLLALAALGFLALLIGACSQLGAPAAAPGAPETEGSGVAATATPIPEQGSAALSDTMPAIAADRDQMYTAPPDMSIDTAKYYYATIKTDKGDIKAQLFAERAPFTVNNFVFLARAGFYDNTEFHRVLDGFMAQAGDPTATGAGGPGYSFQDEFFPGLVFDRPGLLAMANRGPNTNGSQFFITFAPTEWLNDLHTIFGEVIAGSDVLDQLTRRDPDNPTSAGDIIRSIVIEESDRSEMATPTPAPPTATPTNTPTPYAPSDVTTGLDGTNKILAELPTAERVGRFNQAPEMIIDTTLAYTAVISTTQGEMQVTLFVDKAPTAVNNFVLLVNLGFYDGIPINQVTPNEAMIFGSLDNTPNGDAGYGVVAETPMDVLLGKGLISYVPIQRQEDQSMLSSSTILLLAMGDIPPETLGIYSWFGQVEEGIEVLDKLTIEDRILEIRIETN